MGEVKKVGSSITKYELIHQRLEKISKIYFEQSKNIKGVILRQRNPNEDGMANSLIEIPDGDINKILTKEYTCDKNIKGDIGTISPADQAAEIKNIALLAFMANRLSKEYKFDVNHNPNLDEQTRERFMKNSKQLLVWKDQATSDLIASLYTLEQTGGEEYKDLISYGKRIDNNGKSSFVIDIPYTGQMSMHFGNKEQVILDEARNKAESILSRKRQLGQIDNDKYKELRTNLNKSEVLPEYSGKLFEYVSPFPMEYVGPHTKEVIKKIGIEGKTAEEIEQKDIEKMTSSGLNAREAYFLSVKLGFPKDKLNEVINIYNEKEITKGSLRMTNAEERAAVLKYEKNNIVKMKEEKVVGGE